MLFEVEINRVRSGFECEFEDLTRIETESKNGNDSIRQRIRSGFECEFEDSTRIKTESKNGDNSIRQRIRSGSRNLSSSKGNIKS